MLLTPARRKLLSPALLLQPSRNQNYFNRVIAADRLAGDHSGLESSVIRAIGQALDQLHYAGYLGVEGGIFAQARSIIKASCFLCGARTLTGILTPLAEDMPTPTNFNFTGLRYIRRSGLQGDGATTRLGTNRNNNADPQNSNSNLVVVTQAATINGTYMGASGSSIETGDNNFGRSGTNTFFARNRRGNVVFGNTSAGNTLGVAGTVRNNSSNFVAVVGGNVSTYPSVSQTPFDNNLSLFASVSQAGATSAFSNPRILLYLIGEYVDPAVIVPILDRFNTSMQAAIP